MYKAIHFISAIIRQFVLPNPYSSVIKDTVYAELFNIFVGGTIIHVLAYILTGCGYIRGVDSPSSGSLGYLISYVYLTFLIIGFGYMFNSIIWFVILMLVAYIISCIAVGYIFNRNRII